MKKSTLLFFSLLISAVSIAQDLEQLVPQSLPHQMTAEEELRRHEIGRDFTPTDPPMAPVRMVAEFEQMQAVLIRYPFGIPMDLVQLMADDCTVITIVANVSQQDQVIAQYEAAGVNLANCEFLIAPTDSYWTRDYGPWFIADANHEVGICDFPYNRPRPNDDDIPVVLSGYLDIPLYGMDLIHTGGNYMCDGLGIGASTDLVLEENETLTQQEIDTLVSDYLGLDEYYLLPDPLGEYIKHIDCWGKFLDVDKVLIGQVPPSDPRYSDFEYVASFFAFHVSSWGNPYQVYRVYTPGNYPYTPYTNSLILNDEVFVPLTGSQWDDEALAAYADAMPGYEIHGILFSTWENTDALHCRAIGVADLGMLFVNHTPFFGNKPFQAEWTIDAEVIPYSGSGLVADSTLCYYSVDGGDYSPVPLVHQEGYHYTASLPFIEPGSEVSYYLQAKDFSGRKKFHPYIGEPDPHIFSINYATDLLVSPDTLTYLTVDDMLEGLTFHIVNYTGADAIVEEVENEGFGYIPFYIDPWNELPPFTIAHGDTLSFNVKVNIPVQFPAGYIVTDTLDLLTQFGPAQVILKIDSDLLSALEERLTQGPEVKVYPNPVAGEAMITFRSYTAQLVTIDVLDLQGRMISHLTSQQFGQGQHSIRWHTAGGDHGPVPPGIYFIKVMTSSGVTTQKVVIM